jgi:5-methylcytosine-specific restriction endonuclease McrA
MQTRSTAGRQKHDARKGRESLSKKLGRVAKQIKARDGHACVYCGHTAESSGYFLHLDHLTPKSEGGADVPTNLVVACHECNSARKTMTLRQWAAFSAASRGLSFSPATVRAQARRKLTE